MEDSADRAAHGGAAPRTASLALLGLLLVLGGVAGYFVVVLRFGGLFPNVRNHPVAPWLVIAAGLTLSLLAMRRAQGGRRLLPGALLGTSVLLTGVFAAFLHVLLVVPAAPGPAVGSPAADFALADQTGRTRRLADWAGTPLLLVFYRGHW